MARGAPRFLVAIVAAGLVVACGQTGAAPPEGQAFPLTPTESSAIGPTFTPWAEGTQTALAGGDATTPQVPPPAAVQTVDLLRAQIDQVGVELSLTLTANPASDVAYTAIALADQRKATIWAQVDQAQQQAPPPVVAPGQEQGPDSTPTFRPGQERTPSPQSFADEQLTSVAATATMGAALGLPSATPTTTETPMAALRYYLPPDFAQHYEVYGLFANETGYSVDILARDQSQWPARSLSFHAGAQAEHFWPRPRPDMPDPEQVTPVTIRGVEGTSSLVYTALTLAWVEDGQAYVLVTGSYDLQELLAFAESLESLDRTDWERQVGYTQ